MEDRELKLEATSYDMILEGMQAIQPPKKEIKAKKTQTVAISSGYGQELPVQVNIILGNGEMRV